MYMKYIYKSIYMTVGIVLSGKYVRMGSTSSGACEVQCGRCFFGNAMPVYLAVKHRA